MCHNKPFLRLFPFGVKDLSQPSQRYFWPKVRHPDLILSRLPTLLLERRWSTFTLRLVLSKSSSVRFLGKNCKPWTEHRFRFDHMAEPWTECTWTRSGGPVHVQTRFEHWTCLKINKNLEYISFACIACNLQNIQDEMQHSDKQLKSGKFESFIYPDFDLLCWYWWYARFHSTNDATNYCNPASQISSTFHQCNMIEIADSICEIYLTKYWFQALRWVPK